MKIKSHSSSLAVFVFYPFVGLQIPLVFSHIKINNWKRIVMTLFIYKHRMDP